MTEIVSTIVRCKMEQFSDSVRTNESSLSFHAAPERLVRVVHLDVDTRQDELHKEFSRLLTDLPEAAAFFIAEDLAGQWSERSPAEAWSTLQGHCVALDDLGLTWWYDYVLVFHEFGSGKSGSGSSIALANALGFALFRRGVLADSTSNNQALMVELARTYQDTEEFHMVLQEGCRARQEYQNMLNLLLTGIEAPGVPRVRGAGEGNRSMMFTTQRHQGEMRHGDDRTRIVIEEPFGFPRSTEGEAMLKPAEIACDKHVNVILKEMFPTTPRTEQEEEDLARKSGVRFDVSDIDYDASDDAGAESEDEDSSDTFQPVTRERSMSKPAAVLRRKSAKHWSTRQLSIHSQEMIEGFLKLQTPDAPDLARTALERAREIMNAPSDVEESGDDSSDSDSELEF